MTETAPNTAVSTMAAFKKIVTALKAVKPQKRPALLDLAMREAAEDDVPCDCHERNATQGALTVAPPDQGTLL